jgi:hypothetical protein
MKANISKVVAAALAAVLVAGCASTKMETLLNQSDPSIGKPDIVVVHDFAVSPANVELDESVLGKIGRSGATVDVESEAVGRAVADVLAAELVDELNKAGIEAYRAKDAPKTTSKSASIAGYFEHIDQGSRSKRVLIGFGLGGSEVRTHFYFYRGTGIDDAPVAEMMTKATSSLKPGMAASAGIGLATDKVATALVVGATTTAASEAFMDTVAADARRSAKKVAERVEKHYVVNGWL